MGYLDLAGLQYLQDKLKEKFASKSHSHDDRYYTEAEMDGKLNSKVNNNEAGANELFSKLTTSWGATPTDDTYFIRQDINGGNQFGRVKFSTIWNYIKGKADGVYQPKGSYAAREHTHDDRYYTEAEVNSKLEAKASSGHTHDLNSSSLTKLVDNVTTNSQDMVGGNKGFLLRSLRMQAKAPDWLEGNYAAGIAFGGSDTKGVISHACSSPAIKFAGGNGSAPVWWLRLTGTSGKTYNLNAMPPASHTHNSIKDAGNNSSNTTFAYSKAGMNYGDYTWLAGWNGYELRAVNKSQFATAGHTHAQTSITGKPELYTKAEVNTLMKKAMYSEGKLVGTGKVTYSYNSDGTLVVPSTSDYIKIVNAVNDYTNNKYYTVPQNTKMVRGTTIRTRDGNNDGKITFDTNGKITCVGYCTSPKNGTCTYYIEAYQYY